MDAGSIESLELPLGTRVTPAHIAQLDRKVGQNQGLRSVGARRRVYPWGTHWNFTAQSGLASSPIFQPAVTFDGQGNATVTWTGPTATIGGIIPTIGDDPATAPTIFTPDPTTGQLPSLSVPSTLYDANGQCYIYFKVTTYQTQTNPIAQYVQPVALAAVPNAQPWTAYKLALFLRMRNNQPSYQEVNDRELFCSQGFYPILVLQSGKFTPLFWAVF